MPILSSAYHPPIPFRNGHISTIYASALRSVKGLQQQRQRLELPDGDFLDLDWSYAGERKSDKLIILLHGLEGNAGRPYITATAKYFNRHGYDACALNFRGCSGESNRLFRSYHSGDTEDLRHLFSYLETHESYTQWVCKGFSLGGNVLLKYLGQEKSYPEALKAAIAISVPVNLYESMLALHEKRNVLYSDRFKKKLLEKLKVKHQEFPELLPVEKLDQVKILRDIDEVYTAPAHGFANSLAYYTESSSVQVLPQIHIPTLLINALNDSFLSPGCFPVATAEKHRYLHLEMPKYGGHVGFYLPRGWYYNELRALEFCNNTLSKV